MKPVNPVAAGRGFRELERLADEGYRVVEIDSNDLFVGVRMERDGARATVVLTAEDFQRLFPAFVGRRA